VALVILPRFVVGFSCVKDKGPCMSEIQYATAQQLLPIIIQSIREDKSLTYKTAAIALGRPPDNARMVAQVCDLLDAAAAWAGTPLLALTAVKSSTGNYNKKAYSKTPLQSKYRPAILDRSRKHNFTDEDFNAIQIALNEFEGLSNVSAWGKLYERFGTEGLYLRLSQGRSAILDGLNDIGSDVPDTRLYDVKVFVRDGHVREAVIKWADGCCEYCTEAGFTKEDGTAYLESHHIIALAADGEDRLTNVIALCPNHHREAHFGARRDKLERDMIKIVRAKCLV